PAGRGRAPRPQGQHAALEGAAARDRARGPRGGRQLAPPRVRGAVGITARALRRPPRVRRGAVKIAPTKGPQKGDLPRSPPERVYPAARRSVTSCCNSEATQSRSRLAPGTEPRTGRSAGAGLSLYCVM